VEPGLHGSLSGNLEAKGCGIVNDGALNSVPRGCISGAQVHEKVMWDKVEPVVNLFCLLGETF
jgi:hypothetical protein